MTTPQPRPHQVAALTDLQIALSAHDRTQLHMACGTGKTFVGRWHAQASDADLTLVLVPSLALVAQTLREWRQATGQRNTGWIFRALVVCSDPTTTEGVQERELTDDGLAVDETTWVREAARVTTDASEVARFLRGDLRKNDGHRLDRHAPRVIFATYHSAPVVARAQAIAGEASVFDLVVCDEAHRLAGRPSEAFSAVLNPRSIVARKRLFMTATPKPFAGDGYSMDDTKTFGPIAHTISFGDAIAAGLLTDYQVLVIAGKNDTADKLRTVPAALARAVDEHHISRVLSFHGRVSKAAAFSSAIDELITPHGRKIRGRHVSGAMATAVRTETLEWVRNTDDVDEVRVVSNARCLSEGVDVPAVDAILFADQRSSIVEIIQAIGRVLRPAPGKRIGSIILPLGLDDGDDDSALALSAYEHIWTVLRGLRAHDQRLAEAIDDVAREAAYDWYGANGTRHRGGFRIPRIEFVVPNDFDINALELRAVQELGAAWERHYGHLQAWAEAHNGKLIPRSTKVDGPSGPVYIGEWSEQQRILRRRGAIDPGRRQRLEQIPGWAWDKAEAWWRNTYKILVDYAAEHGTIADHHEGVSRFKGMKNAAYPKCDLGVWMAEQRQAYRLGTLPEDYAELLEDLPGWAWDGGLPAVDVDHVEALRQFVEFEKHAIVPDDHLEDGLRLGAWCWAVRRRVLVGRLSPVLLDEILAATPPQFLNDIRFPWEKEETTWRLKYFALRQFAEREGHSRATSRTHEQLPDTTVEIGNWSAQQRFKYRNGELDEQHRALLEQIPGWRWEIELTTVQFEEPVDLSGKDTDHGLPGAWSTSGHGCKCEPCLTAKRKWQREAAHRKAAKLVDPVPAQPVRAHLLDLEEKFSVQIDDPRRTRNGRSLISAASGVAIGIIRKVHAGDVDVIERRHANAITAITAEDLVSSLNTTGSRGRMVSELTAKVDSTETWARIDDLAARGFGITWVGRELGYVGAPQIRRGGQIQRRIHNAIADLYERVGDLVMPVLPRNSRTPSLLELQQAATDVA